MPEREVQVDSIELLELAGDRLSLRITCGSGTYVRSLVRDLGEALGCGAHVTALQRLWVAPFQAAAMHRLDALQALVASDGEGALEALLLPVEAGLAGWRRRTLDATQALALGRGQPVRLDGPAEAGDVQAVDADGRSLGLATIGADGLLRAKRLFRWAAQG